MPKVTQSGFPTIGSLTPEFRWKPCPKQGVSYDFVLYEAATYSFDQMTPLYMRGRVAAYEEGLVEARWQPDTPLKPDTRYFWSVRMREGDPVSHWSTQSHSTFLLVYMSWEAASGSSSRPASNRPSQSLRSGSIKHDLSFGTLPWNFA